MATKRKIEKKVEAIVVQTPKEKHTGHEHEIEHDLDFHGLEDELDNDRD